MNRILVLLIFYCCLVASSPVLCATGDVLSSFTAPSEGTTGLTYDGACIWTVDTLNREFVQLSTTGSVMASFPIPVEVITPVDLAYDGTNLWVTDKTTDKVIQLSTGGTVISSFGCPCTQPMGITYDGSNLWIGSERNEIVQVTTGGTLVTTIDCPVTVPQGLTYADNLLWISGLVTDRINAVTIYGGISVYSFAEPDDNTQGMAYDGSNLWATGSLTDTIYELELNPIAIIPAVSFYLNFILLGIMSVIICAGIKFK